MEVRGLSEKTQKGYIRCVKHFAAFPGRSPDSATPEDLRAYQLRMSRDGVGTPTHYGLFANAARARNIARIRDLLATEPPKVEPDPERTDDAPPGQRVLRQPCPNCGGPMIVIETFDPGQFPRSRAPPNRSAA